jgi:hypothetical protein
MSRADAVVLMERVRVFAVVLIAPSMETRVAVAEPVMEAMVITPGMRVESLMFQKLRSSGS